jgi:hypothetical protein
VSTALGIAFTIARSYAASGSPATAMGASTTDRAPAIELPDVITI